MAKKKSWHDHIIIKLIEIVILFIALDYYLDYKINNKYKEPQLMEQIASHIRPTLIFDQLGTIRSDGGAAQFVSKIEVDMEGGEPNRIVISPTEHLNSAPIIQCINDIFDAVPKQINKSDWLFELSSPNFIVFESSPERKEWLFRLEIIK